jgi:magnesium transporter
VTTNDRDARLQATLEQVTALLSRHRVLETWTHNQQVRQRELLESLVHRQNLVELQLKLRGLHPADLASILQALSVEDRGLIWPQLAVPQASAVLPECSQPVREELIETTPRDTLVGLLKELDADDLGYISESVPAEILEEVYQTRDARERAWIESTAAYPEDSVGRLMVNDYVAVRETATVGQAIEQVRAHGKVSRHLDLIFAVDARNVLRGVLPLRDLLIYDPSVPLESLIAAPPTSFTPSERAEAAAEAFTRYDLVCAPVVDDRGKLLGALTVDALMEVISARATKEIQMMGGLEALDAPYAQVPFWDMVRKRGGWLSALFLGEMLTATAMGHYEAEIARAVVLALFVPLIISSGGNSGSQAASLIIRALALKELNLRDWWKVMQREILSGLTLGTMLGIVGFVRIVLWQTLHFSNYGPRYVSVATTIFLSLIGVVCFGTLAGSMLPFLLRRLGFDPATSSAPFVATLVDVTGLIIYFQVAGIILRGLLV